MALKKILTVFIGLLYLTKIYAQAPNTIDLSFYFESAEATVHNEDKIRLRTTLDSIHIDSVAKITVRGNTDEVGDSLYNIKLSRQRNEAIRQVLLSIGVPATKIKLWHFGEDKPADNNHTEKGRRKNRRVDVRIYYQPVVKIEPIPLPEPDTCDRDTTLEYPNGASLTFNICEYEKLKDCIKVEFATTAHEVLDQNISLQDSRGMNLMSCGMVGIQKKPNCGGEPCFKFPVVVRFPMQKDSSAESCDPCEGRARTFIMTDGRWDLVRGAKARLVNIDGVAFYELDIECAGRKINCDCRLKGPGTVIKLKGDYVIKEAMVYSDCPLFRLEADPRDLGDNQVYFEIPCISGKKYLSLVLENEAGDKWYLRDRDLNTFKKRVWWPVCAPETSSPKIHPTVTGKKQEQKVYRKYIIRKSDIPTPAK